MNNVKKYLNMQFVKNLLIVGAILYTVSFVINAITVNSIFGKDCVYGDDTCMLHVEQIVGKIAMVIGYAGIGIVFVGLALLLIMLAKQRKQ